MKSKRIRAPISFGVASVCVAACSTLNPMSKPSIQSSLEAEELIAPVEVATELQGIDAIPISKNDAPPDGTADRDATGPGGQMSLDPAQSQGKNSSAPNPVVSGTSQGKGAAGALAGKGSAQGLKGSVGSGTAGGSQVLGAQAAGLQAGKSLAGSSILNGKGMNIGQARVAGVNGDASGQPAGVNGVASEQPPGAQAAGGSDAVAIASRDPASAQALNADGSPLKSPGSIKESGLVPVGAARGPASADGAQIIDYRVKEGDTLMKIAFEVFGDLTRWREILELNKEVINDPNVLTKGSRLRIKVFGVRTVSRNGEAYLIKRGDTLQKISQWVYGTINKWKKLWDNNRELIQDPNKIFAGFKLYFVREQDPKRVPAADPAVPAKNDSSH